MTGGLNLWLEGLNIQITRASPVICKLLPFFTYTMLDYSIAIIVIMTGKKLYAVLFPIKANSLNFSRNEFITVFTALCFCCLINSHFILALTLVEINMNSFNKSKQYICTNTKWDDFYQYYWIYIDALVYSLLPFVLISIFNISIIRSLVKEKRKRVKLQMVKIKMDKRSQRYSPSASDIAINKSSLKSNQNSFIESNTKYHILERRMAIVEHNQIDAAFRHKKPSYMKSNKHISIMLFLINISFSILTMPIVILQIINHLKQSNTFGLMLTEEHAQIREENEDFFNLLKAFFELLQYLNHSINFVLYCLSGATFRRETKVVLRNVCSRLSCFNFNRIF